MGLRGLGPPTSPLSGVRSNQLSYSPIKRTTGIEPAFPAWKAGALAIVLHPHYVINKRTTGIEPAFPAWKAGALAIVLHPQFL